MLMFGNGKNGSGSSGSSLGSRLVSSAGDEAQVCRSCRMRAGIRVLRSCQPVALQPLCSLCTELERIPADRHA
jgi:hypothetical protein